MDGISGLSAVEGGIELSLVAGWLALYLRTYTQDISDEERQKIGECIY